MTPAVSLTSQSIDPVQAFAAWTSPNVTIQDPSTNAGYASNPEYTGTTIPVKIVVTSDGAPLDAGAYTVTVTGPGISSNGTLSDIVAPGQYTITATEKLAEGSSDTPSSAQAEFTVATKKSQQHSITRRPRLPKSRKTTLLAMLQARWC